MSIFLLSFQNKRSKKQVHKTLFYLVVIINAKADALVIIETCFWKTQLFCGFCSRHIYCASCYSDVCLVENFMRKANIKSITLGSRTVLANCGSCWSTCYT